MMLKIIKIFSAIALGILSSLIAYWLTKNFLATAIIAVIVFVVSCLIIWIYEKFPKYLGIGGSFAATALVFNGENKTLLVFNPRQKKWVPPGIHIKGKHRPHLVVLEAVKCETGYDAKLHSWHSQTKQIDRYSVEVPQPFYILEETQLDGEGHKFHTDLFYVCVVTRDDNPGGIHDNKWYSLNEVNSLVENKKTYPDVLMLVKKAYDEVISK